MKRRTPEMDRRYEEALNSGTRRSFAEKPPLKEFKHWRIIENEYPYDAIAETHHLLIPKRQTEDPLFLKDEELSEMLLIRRIMTKDYDVIMENTRKGRTVPDWYHLHLIKWN